MNIYDEVLILSEQPTTCPSCGGRTEIILDLSHTQEGTQIHKCLNTSCINIFVAQSE